MSLREQAAAQLQAEMVAAMKHDLQRYPIDDTRKGKKAKKRKPQDDPFQQGPTAFEAEFHLDELAEARQLVEEEAELLRVKYGHADVPEANILALMDAASKEHTCVAFPWETWSRIRVNNFFESSLMATGVNYL